MVKSPSRPSFDRITSPLIERPAAGTGRFPLADCSATSGTWSLWGPWPAVAIANPEGWAIENTMDLSLIDYQHDRKALRAELRPRFAPISDDDSRFLGKSIVPPV